ncbi:MAG: FGGY-family carbohydrate kinase, partial [Mobilitalea sp.]
MIQNVREETGRKYSYAELCTMAEEASMFPSRVDVNDDCFLSPENMSEAVKSYCLKTGQVEPRTIGEMAACIYQSLADSYAKAIKEIESITGKNYHAINIVGGGSKADYLNKLTAKATGKIVYAGPTEATAIGNLMVLMLKEEEFSSLAKARECVYHSFDIAEVGV